jgi:signal transduction histidine kinase
VKSRRRARSRWWNGAAVGLAAGLLLLAGSVTWSERGTALTHAQTTGRHLAATLEQHASRTIEAVDFALRLSADRWASRPPGPLDPDDGRRLLQFTLMGSPQLRAISLFGADGRRLFSSEASHDVPLDISDHQHFADLRDHPTGAVVIGAPVESVTTGRWEIPVARGLRDADDHFGGALIAAVDPGYFVQSYSPSEIGRAGTIALVRRDGMLLARIPPADGGEPRLLGQPPVASPSIIRRLAKGDQADWAAPARGADPERLISIRASPSLPVVAVVALGRDEMLAPWRIQAWRTMLSAAALAALIVLFTARLTREMARSERAYAQLARAEARLRDAIDVLPEQLMIFDAEDRLVMCNEAVRRRDHPPPNWSSIGCSFEEILRARLEAISSFEQRPRRRLETRLEHHRDPGPPLEIHTPEGRCFRVTERRTAEGGLVLLRVDLTELHKLTAQLRGAKAEAERVSLAKSDMLAAVSHEIRTPLNGIIGFAELLLAAKLAPEHHQKLLHVRSAGQALLALANDMLDLSRAEAGRIRNESRDFDLGTLLDECTSLIARSAAAKGIALLCSFDATTTRLVSGDAARLRQVLLNLLGNAIKFTDAGEIAVTVRPAAAKDHVTFIVRDTGIGITDQDLPLLFERFTQLGDPERHAGGVGLGLAISRSLVELMGGTLEVASAAGRGSQFSVTLPLPAGGGSPLLRYRSIPSFQAARRAASMRPAGPSRALAPSNP